MAKLRNNGGKGQGGFAWSAADVVPSEPAAAPVAVKRRRHKPGAWKDWCFGGTSDMSAPGVKDATAAASVSTKPSSGPSIDSMALVNWLDEGHRLSAIHGGIEILIERLTDPAGPRLRLTVAGSPVPGCEYPRTERIAKAVALRTVRLKSGSAPITN